MQKYIKKKSRKIHVDDSCHQRKKYAKIDANKIYKSNPFFMKAKDMEIIKKKYALEYEEILLCEYLVN